MACFIMFSPRTSALENLVTSMKSSKRLFWVTAATMSVVCCHSDKMLQNGSVFAIVKHPVAAIRASVSSLVKCGDSSGDVELSTQLYAGHIELFVDCPGNQAALASISCSITA